MQAAAQAAVFLFPVRTALPVPAPETAPSPPPELPSFLPEPPRRRPRLFPSTEHPGSVDNTGRKKLQIRSIFSPAGGVSLYRGRLFAVFAKFPNLFAGYGVPVPKIQVKRENVNFL